MEGFEAACVRGSGHDLDETWKTYVAEDNIMHPPAGVELDRESWLATEKALFAALEDVDVKVLDQVVEGEIVASRWSLTARQTAEFMGVPARGRTASVTGILFDRVRDDKVAEHWAEIRLPHSSRFLAPPSSTAVHGYASSSRPPAVDVATHFGTPQSI